MEAEEALNDNSRILLKEEMEDLDDESRLESLFTGQERFESTHIQQKALTILYIVNKKQAFVVYYFKQSIFINCEKNGLEDFGVNWWLEYYQEWCTLIEEEVQRAKEEARRQRQAEKEAREKQERDARQAREEYYAYGEIVDKINVVEQESAETDDTTKAEEERRLRQEVEEQRRRAEEKKAAEHEELYTNTLQNPLVGLRVALKDINMKHRVKINKRKILYAYSYKVLRLMLPTIIFL